MSVLYAIFVDPFAQMAAAPDLLAQTIWEGLVGGVLYALIALGFVLIYKASGVFNFAQGIMMVFAALTLVGLHEKGVPAWIALGLTIAVMYALALGVERLVLRPLVNQPDIMLLMATFGLTYFLIGFGELVFGGNPKSMITKELWLPDGAIDLHILRGTVTLQKLDIAAAAIALAMVAGLGFFFQKTRIGRALRAVADDHQAALSVGISLEQILGRRLVRGRSRGARDRHHVGRPFRRLVRIAGGRAEGAAGADPGRPHLDPRRHRRRADHRRRRKARRVLLGAAARRRHRTLAGLFHRPRVPAVPPAGAVRGEDHREDLRGVERHCERSEATQGGHDARPLDCFAPLAMTDSYEN